MKCIEVVKLNESHVKIFSSIDIETELKDYFTFKTPGYQFDKRYKAKLWDGTISLYNIRTKILPIGLFYRVEEFCSENDIEIKFVECDRFSEVQSKNDVDEVEVQSFVNDLNLWSPNGPITAKDYQVSAIHKALNEKRLTLLSPTASGKSVIIYSLIRWILEETPDSRILLLVPTVALVNQMINDFKEYSQQNGFKVDSLCQKLYSGQSKDLSKRVLVTTWQSFTNIANDPVNGHKVLALYQAVIADEAHTCKGKVIQSILEKCSHAHYRIGTTGTIDTGPTAKVNVLQIEGYLGKIHKVITTRELIDTNQVSGLKINAIALKYPVEYTSFMKKADYQQEIDWLVSNETRNNFLCKIALTTDGTTLLLVKHVEKHAEVLYKMLQEKSERPVYYISGSVDVDERERIRKVANIENCIIVATFQTMSTGVNIPNIRHVIFGCPSKSSIPVLQSIGRGLRLHSDKSHMTLWDIIDDIRYKKRENYSYQHGLERLKIYTKEKFDIRVKELPFKM